MLFLILVMVYFAENVVCTELTNVALRKYTDQSSVYATAVSGLAVDGNTNQQFYGGSCTHTIAPYPNTFWEVDLGDIYVIDSVELYNRMDCCGQHLKGVEIYGGMNRVDYNLIGYYAGTIGSTYKFQMTKTIYARWIRVERKPTVEGPLVLCEVVVMGFKMNSVTFQRIADASGTVAPIATVSAKSWAHCCYMCLKTKRCISAELRDSECRLLESNAYQATSGENIYLFN